MRVIQKYIYGIAALFLFVAATSILTVPQASAAAGRIYLSPASQSVQNSGTVVVNLRVNPGVSIDTVTANVSYDSAKLTLLGIDCSGSPFTAFPSCPTGGNPVAVTGASLGGGVTADSHVAKFTFKAKVGSGSSTIGLSGNSATAGNPNDPSATAATINFTTPACPSGQTGTWPNCTTAATGGSSSGGGSTSGTSGKTSTGSTSTKPTSTTSTTSPNSPTPATPSGSEVVPADVSPVGVKVASSDVQFSVAKLNVVSDQPTQVYISYGTDQRTYKSGALSDFATTHDLTLDQSALVPGTTYYYTIVSKDKNGKTTQTEVRSFRTKGLSITVGVFDKKRQPIRNKTVTLHSEPRTGKTDDRGFVTFTDVAPGTHHIVYKAGKKEYKQPVAVENNVESRGQDQTASMQNIAVLMPVSAPRSIVPNIVLTLMLLILAGVAYVLFKRRDGILQRLIPAPASSYEIPQTVHDISPIVSSTPRAPLSTQPFNTTPTQSVDDKLRALSGPQHPTPGSTIMPQDDQQDHQS